MKKQKSLAKKTPFPAGVGKPALRALAAAGYTHLEQLTAVGDAALLRLHGVGPKAVKVIRAALETMSPDGRRTALLDQLTERWGCPTHSIPFDASRGSGQCALQRVEVHVWDADDESGVTSFTTVGMSEFTMPETADRVELSLAHRGKLSSSERDDVARFLANVSEYPFENGRALRAWERLVNPGKIPAFSGCTQVLMAPSLGEPPFDHFAAPCFDVRILYLMPVTPLESRILAEHGWSDFLDHLTRNDLDPFAARHDPVGAA